MNENTLLGKCYIGCIKDFNTCCSDTFTTDENSDFNWCAEFEGAKNTEQPLQPDKEDLHEQGYCLCKTR